AVLLVGLGGAVGSMARYGVGRLVGFTGFPLATLIVNVAGSLLMGILVGCLARSTPAWSAEARLLLATGVLGGFTTFSAFSLDAISLMERGQTSQALAYIALSLLLSLGALALGLWLMRGG